eukprot:XP_001706200.1 Hypothetical protein GL50803_115038 [Giardia lamblia ATCC 50803]
MLDYVQGTLTMLLAISCVPCAKIVPCPGTNPIFNQKSLIKDGINIACQQTVEYAFFHIDEHSTSFKLGYGGIEA